LKAAAPKPARAGLAAAKPVARSGRPLRALLDVNVWVALFDDAHQFSARANAFINTKGAAIATCPLTENGVMRVLSLPSYARHGGLPLQVVRARLIQACTELNHEFWPDDLSLRDDAVVDFSRVQGHNQITDLYLLALAVKHGGRLVTFDQGIALSSVRGAGPQHLVLL
jgi:uncharacterized protein